MARSREVQAAIDFGCPCRRGEAVDRRTGMCPQCTIEVTWFKAVMRDEMTVTEFRRRIANEN